MSWPHGCAILWHMELKLINEKAPLNRQELSPYALEWEEKFVKAVVDIEREQMVVGGELHADEEAWLINNGSEPTDLWGINLYVDRTGEDWLEFNSMINLRPSQNNRTRGVDDPVVCDRIREIVKKLII